ncbi:MAG: SUMF1/EgtB/PvdO family nonheme iron enzyme [Verrucomicrobia bacterium]|nr:SUMF1/EgtB/PvdO family nonheme iron enzyme [Verrucomicrobiota bacterium]
MNIFRNGKRPMQFAKVITLSVLAIRFTPACSPAQSPPRLTITDSNGTAIISWPASNGVFKLQFRPDLSTALPWTEVTNQLSVNFGTCQVMVTPADDAGFFRLLQSPLPGFTNSIGMKFVQIPSGSSTMGYWQTDKLPSQITNVGQWFPDYGDYDEKPAHQVTITRPFFLGVYEVSNAEFEQFDPSHHALRGKLGFSTNDNEAVVFVSWEEAKAFCDWLSVREGKSYRLPTEAEWEFACRAATTTHFSTGDTLPAQYQKNPTNCWYPDPNRPNPGDVQSLVVGQTPPNPWGLYDMHGNVEEWCHDWYGPYVAEAQTDPVGRADALAKVTRGGSHSTFAFHLRSENRMGALPEDKSWYIGFRVVMADLPATPPLPESPPEPYQTNVNQTIPADIETGPNPLFPFFKGPNRYVNIPANSVGPVYSGHNHDPSITQCPNGDLLAIWYTTVSETGRELALAASRLRYGQTNWETASSLYDLPDRNDHAPALYTDANGTIHHFNGVSTAATWGPLAVLLRSSTNNGVSWSKPRLILPEHNVRHQLVPSVFRISSGAVVLTADAVSTGNGGTAVHVSNDGMLTWNDPGAGRPKPSFTNSGVGAWLAGIHGNVAEMTNGGWLAFGRGDTINGMMPKSISSDQGTNWTYSASVFQPIGGGQRVKLLRLKEGPLFLASFCVNMTITNLLGGTRTVSGLFASISYDDGATWPFKRLVSDDGLGHSVETTDGELFTMSFSNAEPKGYLDAVQARNGVIHLISSRQHYQFNFKWLETPSPAVPVSP